jgi:hypothetical protein
MDFIGELTGLIQSGDIKFNYLDLESLNPYNKPMNKE